MRIKVAYTVELKPHELKAVVALGREWGFDHDKASNRRIAQRALQNSGVSGCLSNIPSEPSSQVKADWEDSK